MRASHRSECDLELDTLIEDLCDRYLERLLRARAAQLEASSPDHAHPEAAGMDPGGIAAFADEERARIVAGDRSIVEADARKLLAESGVALGETDFDELCCALQLTLIRGFLQSHEG